MSDGVGPDPPAMERERALLGRIIDTITAGLDLEDLLQGLAAIITEATATDVCFVHLLDEDQRRLILSGATPPFDQHAGEIHLALGEGVAGWVAAHQQPVIIIDNKWADARYRYVPELRGEDFTSLVSVPMASGPGRLVGVLNVHSRQRRDFGTTDVRQLRAIANLMAGAVENARLHRQLAVRERARERFAEQLIEVQENERRRLARDIHDGISERIVGLSFRLSAAASALDGDPSFAAEQIAVARELADAALAETRTAIAGLRPSVLDDLGLAAGLESLGRSQPGLAAELAIDASCALAEHVETALYRIAQEALQNVAKHAHATTVRVRFTCDDDKAQLEITDDGDGFDPHQVAGRDATTYGLAGMRERAELVGARLDVSSRVGGGTSVTVTVQRR